MPALYMNDELDHLGMYIDNNCYTQTLARQARDSGPDINNDLNLGFKASLDIGIRLTTGLIVYI